MTRSTVTTTTRTRLAATAASLVTAALVLSACGGDGEASGNGGSGSEGSQPAAAQENVYEFEQAKVVDGDDEEPFIVSDAPLTVRLSDELASAVPSGRSVAVDEYTLTGEAFSTGLCRVVVEVAYASGGEEALSSYANTDSAQDLPPGQKVLRNITGYEGEIVDAVPDADAIDEGGRYITSDLSTITLVEECGDPGSKFPTLDFPYVDDPGDSFAGASFNVEGGGPGGGEGVSLVVTHGGVEDAGLSVDGTWVAEEGE